MDNTRAKQRTRTITQEYVWVAIKHTTTYNYSPCRVLHKYAGFILDNEMGEHLEYRHLIKHLKYKETWSHSYDNEIGRLAQGVLERVKGTDMRVSITKTDVP